MTNSHKTHNVLGRYCWDCRCKTAAGIPGWPIGHQGEFTHYSPWVRNEAGEGNTVSIIWANGDTHRRREETECSVCYRHCGNPVERGFINRFDKYREIKVSEIKES